NTPSHSNEPSDIRRQPTAPVDTPQLTPDTVSSAPNPNLPVRGDRWRIGNTDSNFQPDGPGSSTHGTGSGNGSAVRVNIPDEPPPAVPTQTPPVKILRISTVINNKAISLPKPNYPALAKQIKLQGIVNVQVLIDERGNVISAKAVSGHPFLIPEAQRAAIQAKFSPAFIGEQPVKVSGVISYNFVLSN
ncbi:MAG TPA: energy transducer TonB, partial [Pyrinomonadaceae bacterium]|nr:energy transducer TonB [Pyrinomonadaceae bacterium]